ncbi:hypothetical protein ACJJTC_003788 [Scirpophaga incertulas]
MCAAIENPAKCEVRAVIRFFIAKGYSAAAIHRELCAVYGPKFISEGVVREWERLFKSGRENVHVKRGVVDHHCSVHDGCQKILTDHHKTQRMASALDFLSRYEDEGEPLLNRIVTGDETWIKYVNPETKEQSMMWAHSDYAY